MIVVHAVACFECIPARITSVDNLDPTLVDASLPPLVDYSSSHPSLAANLEYSLTEGHSESCFESLGSSKSTIKKG